MAEQPEPERIAHLLKVALDATHIAMAPGKATAEARLVGACVIVAGMLIAGSIEELRDAMLGELGLDDDSPEEH